MEGFTIIDGIVAAVIILSALLAYSRGLVREALAIGGWIAAGVLAFIFAPQVQPLVKEIPFIGPFIADNCELAMITAFAAVFAVVLLLASLFTPLFSTIIQRSALGGLDQALGFLFGVTRGLLLVAIAFFAYETIFTSQRTAIVDESRSAQVFGRLTGKIEQENPQEALGWVTRQYEQLIGSCDAP
jgi:membrane protein required for colicin V production